MATASATSKAPEVYKALGEILKSLSVEKGGQLPSNMGGKPYITAVDLNNEIKRKFVEHDLILLPNETIIQYDTIQANNRTSIVIAVEGRYKIISTKDSSVAEISGSGDGLANGSAVASNIASTNALKNALLRTFLVTEQSVEDQAKAGVPDNSDAPATQSPAAKKIDAARKPVSDDGVAEIKKRIRETYVDTGIVDTTQLNAIVAEIKGSGPADIKVFEAVEARLKNGEVA